MPSRTLAAAFSLVCFAAALLAGVAVGNAVTTVLGRGLVVLVAAYAVGRLLESAAASVLQPPTAASADGGATAEDAAVGDLDPTAEDAAGPRTSPLGGLNPAADAATEPDLRRAA